jgi:hypothetical protein
VNASGRKPDPSYTPSPRGQQKARGHQQEASGLETLWEGPAVHAQGSWVSGDSSKDVKELQNPSVLQWDQVTTWLTSWDLRRQFWTILEQLLDAGFH